MGQAKIIIHRGHRAAVLVANAILWVAAIVLVGTPQLGGPAAIALIYSIGGLHEEPAPETNS